MRLRKVWSWTVSALQGRGTATFLAIALILGVLVGLAAAALIASIDWVGSGVAWAGRRTDAGRWVLLAAIPAGFLAAWLIARRFLPDSVGDGAPEVTMALAVRAGYIPTRSVPVKLLTTAFTVGSGGSAGREGPMVHIGSAVGSSLARHTGLGEDRVRSLVAAGAGAAIAASFNAPIAGMLFAIEVILGNFAIRHLNAVVVACVTAAVTTRSIVGEGQILRAVPHRLEDPRDLVLYAVLGVLAALVGWLFLRFVHGVLALRDRPHSWPRPVLMGLVVAGIGIVEPDVLGTGQQFVNGMVDAVSADSLVWFTLIGLALLKMVTTSLTMSAGGSGGAFMPSLFMGAGLGAAFAALVGPVWGVSVLQPGAFAVVGMAAVFAAVARAPLTSILIVFEVTQDYGLVLPLMLATSLATFIGDRVHSESIYSLPLVRRGIRLTRGSDIDLLDTVSVGEVVRPDPVSVAPRTTTRQLQVLLDQHRLHGMPVLDDGRLVGIVTATDVVRGGGSSDEVLVGDIMTPRPSTVTTSTLVSQALERMASLGVGRMPVVDGDDPTRLVGMFLREDAIRAYHHALGREVDHDLVRSRLRARVAAQARFNDLVVPAGSAVEGRPLREIPLPAGATVVSVRRGVHVLVPDGSTRLHAGDVVTIFANEGVDVAFVSTLDARDTAELELAATEREEARFFDLEVPAGSGADGFTLRELAVPRGCTVVAVRRGAEVIVPSGETVLRAGDLLTVFSEAGPRRALVERLHEGLG